MPSRYVLVRIHVRMKRVTQKFQQNTKYFKKATLNKRQETEMEKRLHYSNILLAKAKYTTIVYLLKSVSSMLVVCTQLQLLHALASLLLMTLRSRPYTRLYKLLFHQKMSRPSRYWPDCRLALVCNRLVQSEH